jgi:hypothetical protein
MDYLSMLERLLGPGKKASGSEWIFACPNGCGDKLWANEDTGLYHCFVCSYRNKELRNKLQQARNGTFFGSGNIRLILAYFKAEDLLEEEIPFKKIETKVSEFPISEFRAVMTECFKYYSLTDSHKSYLHDRGFSVNYWRARGVNIEFEDNPLKACSSERAYQWLKKNVSLEKRISLNITTQEETPTYWLKFGRILLPYLSNSGILAVRARSTLGLGEKYLWPKGTKSSRLIYSLRDIYNEDLVIVTEGEFKSALPTLLGFPTIGIPGITTAIDLVSQYLYRKKVKRCIICLDSETKQVTKENVEASVKSIKHKLTEMGIPTRVLTLPLGDSDKMDLDGFLVKKGPEEFKCLLSTMS